MSKINDPQSIRKIEIAAYDPRWPQMFEAEKTRILDAVGPWIVQIEHMGSTSVPGLGAKPIIDMMIGVRTLAEADAHCIQPIEALGYEYISLFESEMPERRYFRRHNSAGVRTHQIHLVAFGGPFWERHLAFRDYLRAHPEEARAYEALKRELAPKFSDVNDYAEAKTEFVKAVEARAFAWKAQLP